MLKCSLCEKPFKNKSSLTSHQNRKTACVSTQKVLNIINGKSTVKKIGTMEKDENYVKMIEEQSDLFRKLHVRTQKQLAEWRKQHEKCSISLEKRARERAMMPMDEETRKSFEKFMRGYDSDDSVEMDLSDDNLIFNEPEPNSSQNNNNTNRNEILFTNFGGGDSNDNNNFTTWSTKSSSGVPTRFSAVTNPTNGFNTSHLKPGTWSTTKTTTNRIPPGDGQLVRPGARPMTTTNTTTTNITNNIININVKLCAPGFESIQITDSRGLQFSYRKRQRIADHLQNLLEIMMESED